MRFFLEFDETWGPCDVSDKGGHHVVEYEGPKKLLKRFKMAIKELDDVCEELSKHRITKRGLYI